MEATARGPNLWQAATLAGRAAETASAATLQLEVPGFRRHRAGQHVDVRLTAEDGYQAQRSYSIASAPGEAQPRLTVERIDDGEVSPYLVDEMQPGDEMEIRGPLGGWFVWTVADRGPLLLIAGGSGVVPLMSMLRHRRAERDETPSRLLLSARTEADAIYRGELAQLADAGDGLEISTTLTRAAPEGWRGYEGRIDETMIREVAWAPGERPLVFICGPTEFAEAASNHLVRLGHDPAAIKTERFGPTGGT
ncbi:MAG: ferredoxin reductase [Solirubrobacterales bacterium]